LSVSESDNQPSKLLKSTAVTGSMTLLSRISGLARDKAFSFWFGSEPVMDAFFVAFKIPNLFRRFFAEGAFSQAFVPVLAEFRAQRGVRDVRELVAKTAGTLGTFLFLITLVGVVAAPLLIYVFAPGFESGDGRRVIAVQMLRFTFPYLFFISLTALAGAILNTYRQFAVPAFTPVLLNVVLILFAGWIAPGTSNPGVVLAIGVFVAGMTQLAFQSPFLIRAGLLPRPTWAWRDSDVQRVLRQMMPIMFGSTVAQINILFDTLIASLLAAGSISWLYYSDRLVEFPLGVFGIALATVIMPALSTQHALKSDAEFSETLDWALHLVLLIALPAALGLILLSRLLIGTIFFGGAFSAFDVTMAGASLIAYSPGLIGFILVKVLAPGYFARQDPRTPVRIAIRALVLGMVLNVVFVVTLQRTGWAPPHAGLAAATSLSALFNASLLLIGLIKNGSYRPQPGWGKFTLQVIAASGAMAMFLVLLNERAGDWLALGLWQRILALLGAVVAAVVIYFMSCLVVGLNPARFRSHRAD
jgi:putative peptidoglycan lipid II flippase